jgi:signal transduction histidine kinase
MILESSFRDLKKSAHHSPSLLDGVTHIEACLRQSQHFLDDWMTLANTGSVDMEPTRVELTSAVQEVLFEIEPLLLERDVRVIVGADLPAVWCNPARTKQVLSNLLRNAVKHGCDPRRAEIHIGRPAGTVRPAPAGHVWLEVYDNGPGIPAASSDEIFLPGRRLACANPSGTGMGLAIVRKIVEHYGGVACVDADCRSGARLLVSFPQAD